MLWNTTPQLPPASSPVTPTKPCRTQRDLSLAYTPGVAVPCLEIERDPSLAYKYTAKGNLVGGRHQRHRRARTRQHRRRSPASRSWKARPSSSSASPISTSSISSSPPRMPTRSSAPARLLEPTFGGINLEDIKAPECFYIEEDAAQDHEDPGLPRRSARHRDHLRRRPAQCARNRRQAHRRHQGGLQRRRRQRASPAPRTTSTWACAARTSSCATPRA